VVCEQPGRVGPGPRKDPSRMLHLRSGQLSDGAPHPAYEALPQVGRAADSVGKGDCGPE
jgi:hypothetical protein